MQVKAPEEGGKYFSLVKLLKPTSLKRAKRLLSEVHEAIKSASQPIVNKRKNESQMGPVTVIQSSIAGKRYQESVEMAVGETVLLERDPENPFDPNAIKVLQPETKKQLGYVPRAHALELAALMDSGTITDISSCIAGGGDVYHTPIIITYEKSKRAKRS